MGAALREEEIVRPSGRMIGLASTSGNGRCFARISSSSGAGAPVHRSSNSAGFRRAAELRNPRPVSGFGPVGRCFDADSAGEKNPERVDVSAEAPSGFSSFGGGFLVRASFGELAKSGCPVAKSVCDVELRVVVGWGRKGVRFEGNFGTYPRRSRDHPGFPTGETDPFGGLGVPVG